MFDFDQYLGFITFLSILTMGFWLLIFLLGFAVPFWLIGANLENLKMWMDKKCKEKKGCKSKK